MQKFEPGENDRALSQVITEAISPRKTHEREMGVVGMVKEAVTSLLHNEETASQPTITSPSPVSIHPHKGTTSTSCTGYLRFSCSCQINLRLKS